MFPMGYFLVNEDSKMTQHDNELLDKQLWGVSPSPRNDATIGLMVIAMFLAGMTIGGILFAHENKRMKIMSHDAMAAISLPNSAPPIMQK